MFKNIESKTKAYINKVQISLNPNKFIEDISNINQKDVYQLQAIILKVLSKILPNDAIFEATQKVVKVEFVGKASQTLPEGAEKIFNGKTYLYKIVGQVITNAEGWGKKIEEFYFSCESFNIFTLIDGTIVRQVDIENGNEKQINQVVKQEEEELIEIKKQIKQNIQKPQQQIRQKKVKQEEKVKQVEKVQEKATLFQSIQKLWKPSSNKKVQQPKIQSRQEQLQVEQQYYDEPPLFHQAQIKQQIQKPKNKRQFIQKKLQSSANEKNWGYNQLTFHQKEDAVLNLQHDDGLLQQLNHTLTKIGIIVQLYPNTIVRKFKLSGAVQLINPNRSIREAEFKEQQVIKIQDSDHLVYYFSNPQLLPIFIKGTVPKEILQYNLQINKQMEQLRKNQKENVYAKQYNVLSTELIKGAKIYIYEGETWYCGVKEVIKWLKNAGFDVTYQYKKTLQLRSQSYDIIWISSSSTRMSEIDVDYIVKQYKQGVGLFLWGDNQPYYVQANQILAKVINPKYQLIGNYMGLKLLKASHQLGIGTFDLNHPVSSGFATLHEGHTICHPCISHPDIEVFAYNTNPQKQQSLVYRKPKENEGYLWIDNGFTKYMDYDPSLFQKVKGQVEQYIINVCCTIMKKRKI